MTDNNNNNNVPSEWAFLDMTDSEHVPRGQSGCVRVISNYSNVTTDNSY